MRRLTDGLRFAAGTLTVFRVRVDRVDRQVAGQAMTLAPVIGLVLAAVAGLPLLLPVPPLLDAALALGLLALLTRGLHLDGLADLADGLGSGRPAGQALDIMRKSDIGPFGVVTLTFTLLVQVAALTYTGLAALVTACVAGRLALTWACRAGVPAARPDGLGATVAGSVRPAAPWLVTLAALLAFAGLGLSVDIGWWRDAPRAWAAETAAWLTGSDTRDTEETINEAFLATPDGALGWDPRFMGAGDTSDDTGDELRDGPVTVGCGLRLPAFLTLPAALLTGLLAALALLRRARRRLGGITGDVLGALVETATAAALVACAVLG
ncbi:adenosylcobinamide-GDP ribazoletransferase [Actinomadura sp. ATCC 31491]|uniref:Adenosylcobinamide-GDP ribazoletransferase n=1 Tax=Actinomadura luzonensis TaxID=2805427 RepID=A0ABT0G7Q5_9ACTN|nr:adenosylcobinamide-GDP ribazoletransferase [Actinomadura luzonensis]MCK2220626.1 adenosylcobinamide-GDP ribazoletransferase [Actinomadura luzonensis]